MLIIWRFGAVDYISYVGGDLQDQTSRLEFGISSIARGWVLKKLFMNLQYDGGRNMPLG